MNVTVIGIGAMGGGMARALLRSETIKSVIGYDKNQSLVDKFEKEAEELGKKGVGIESGLRSAVEASDAVIIVLVNEKQCAQVCFEQDGSVDEEKALISSMKSGQCLILCSTVSPTFAKNAEKKFRAKGIYFVDCPISGGPVRAKSGELTMMSSGDETSLQFADPLLHVMGSDVYNCGPNAGMGSTVKMVHQLLAGTHIAAAAEALSLAAKAGIDVKLMYDVVSKAAGSSWMFMDRGKRMIADPHSEEMKEVKSALSIFVKDLGIVHDEAKALFCPTPISNAALNQFIAGVGMGLGKKDDSQLTKVYEQFTGVPVGKTKLKLGDEVGDLWEIKPGVFEEIVEVANEPCHNVVLENEYIRLIKVKFEPNYTTVAHRHAEDSLYYFLVEDGLHVINHVKGSDPACDCMEFGEVRFGTHKEDKPLVHRITNLTKKDMFCIDAEVLKSPPVTSVIPLIAEHHELIKTRDKCRVYHVKLEPGETMTVTYAFFGVHIALKESVVEISCGKPAIVWTQKYSLGDTQWKEPCVDIKMKNIGETTYEAYISEWR